MASPPQTNRAARVPVVSVIGTSCRGGAIARIEVRARFMRRASQNVAWGSLSRRPPFLALDGRPRTPRAGNARRSVCAARENACVVSGSIVRVPSCVSVGRALPLFPTNAGDGKFGMISSSSHAALDGIRRSHPPGGYNRRHSRKNIEFLLGGDADVPGAQCRRAPPTPRRRLQVWSSSSAR